MRSHWSFLFILILVAVFWGIQVTRAQQAAKPLTERELTYLIEKKVSGSALADMVQSYGVSFLPDAETIARLRRAGASEVLLEAIRQKVVAPISGSETAKPDAAGPEPEAVPPLARKHLQLGQEKLRSHDYEGALEELAEAERNRPMWDQVFNQRGLALAGLARYSEAAAEWKKYLSLLSAGVDKGSIQNRIMEWESVAARIEKARALSVQGDQQLLRGDAGSAAQTFREALTLNKSLGALLALARAQLLEGNYKGLAATAREAEALDPESALANLYLADAELRRGNLETSALERGLSLNPNLAYGRALLARALRQRASKAGGKEKQAAVESIAGSAEERNRRGWVMWNGGHFQPALEELNKATLLHPTEDGWQCDLAYARLARRDTAGALAAAREAVRVNSESACGHHALALAMDRSGRHDLAALEYERAEKLTSALGALSLLRLSAAGGGSTATKP